MPDEPEPPRAANESSPVPPANASPAERGSRPPRRSRIRTGVLAAAAVVVVGAPSAAAVALALHRGGNGVPALETLLPAGHDVYALADLDPSLTDKARILLHRFPDLSSEAQLQSKLRSAIDDGLRPTGLSFAKDVQPWLASQLAAVASIDGGDNSAFLLSSKDDGAARAALTRLRTGPEGQKYGWSDSDDHGVTISSGKPTTTSSTQPLVYTLVDHVVVIGTSTAAVAEVIDTAQGRRAALPSNARFAGTMSLLPSNRLGFVYLDGPALARKLRSSAGLSSADQSPGLAQALSELDAVRGLAAAVTAESSSVTADTVVNLDPAKLTSDTRRQLSAVPRQNAALGFVPARAYGFIAFPGVQAAGKALSSYLDTADQSTRQSVDRLGLTGPQGVLAHLTGDAAIEVGPGAARYPRGALLVGTDDETGMRAFLSQTVGLAAAGASGAGATGSPAVAPHSETYRGVSITSVTVAGLSGAGVEPAYAVTGGMAIVASSPDEVKAAIDAHTGGGITSAADFQAAGRAAGTQDPFLYLNIAATVGAVRQGLPLESLGSFDRQVAPNLAPLRAVMVAGGAAPDRLSARLVLLTR